MAYSNQTAVSDGSLQTIILSIGFFDKSEIRVFKNGVEVFVSTDFVWATSNSIQFPSALPNGTVIQLRRTTDISEMRHIFTEGAQFNNQTLDEDYTQILHIAQESREGGGLTDVFNPLDMHQNKIVNLAPGTNPADAVNLQQLQEGVTNSPMFQRAVRVPQSEGLIAELPAAAMRANKLLTFDSTGAPMVVLPSFDSATALAIDLLNASDPLKGAARVGGTGRYVDTIAALRALPKAGTPRVFVCGYGKPGDGGGGTYWYDPSDTTSSDNGGTLIVANDGGRWKLTQAAPVTIRQFGAVGDGSANDANAILQAHTALISVHYPPGVYRCASRVALTGQVVMTGDAPGSSNLLFNGATQGIDITQQTSAQIFSVSKLSFVTTNSTAAFTGLRINGIPQITTNTDGLRFFLGDRNKYRGKVWDVVFTGQTNASGWGVGLNMEAMMNYDVHNITYTGLVPAVVGDLTGCAILLNGDGGGTDIRFTDIWVYYAKYSMLAPDYLEGLHVTNYEFVVVTYGIVAKYNAAYSKLPAASSGLLSVYAHHGHINCLQGGLVLEKTNGNFIGTQNIYLQPRAADGNAFGVLIDGGNDHHVRDVFVGGDGAANSKTNNYGVLLRNVGLSSVDTVTGTSVQAPVSLVGSSFNDVTNLQARACANGCVADAGSSQNKIGPVRASGLIGAKYNVSLDNNICMEEYAGFTTRTLAAGASANISIPLPLGTFSEAPRFATLSIDQSSIYYKWQYLRGSSSSSQVTFLLAPASPATTIPAETIEVAVNCKGI